MKNITLVVDEDVLATVRAYAARTNTTVNALVREYLTRLAQQEDEAGRARRRLVELAADSQLLQGTSRWNRDEIYDRGVLSGHERPDLRGFAETERCEEEDDRH